MSVHGEIDLCLGVLDHQLVDSDDRRCGKVDDLELEGVRDGNPRVSAIVTGPGGWRGRGRLGRLLAALVHARTVTIPWEEVAEVGADVRLRRPARELGLGWGHDLAARWVEKLPGSSL
jgi:sporulation protein YlmC with PRC-barrel domain